MMWKPGSDRPKAKTESKSSKALLSANVIPVSSGKAPPAKPASADDKRATSKAALSQKTLAMKFMQRKKQSETQKHEAQRKQDTWSTVQPVDPAEDSDKIVCTRDVPDPSLPVIFGRRSFGGFNKGVEVCWAMLLLLLWIPCADDALCHRRNTEMRSESCG